MHMKELMKLRALHDKATEFFASLQWKKESFELLSHDEKIYSIVKNMEQMLEEVGETIDIEYNKSLDHQRPCLEDDLNGGSNNIVQSNKSVWRRW